MAKSEKALVQTYVPVDLRNRVQEVARANDRSLAQELRRLLVRTYGDAKPPVELR